MNGAPLILSANMRIGHFLNAQPGWGWTARFDHLQTTGIFPFRYEDEIFEYTLDPVHPLTWVDCSGAQWQTDRHGFRCNGGTIPAPFRFLRAYHPMRYPRAYGYHDDIWTPKTDVPGREGESLHGLWRKRPWDADFSFCEISRTESNFMLRDMIVVEGGPLRRANTIRCVVEYFGKRW
jgi:hypothetical protein